MGGGGRDETGVAVVVVAERMGVTKERGGWGNDYIEAVLLSARREPAARLPLTWALLLGQRPSVA